MLILFPFARYHVCWCMQTCNVYMDSTIIFYFLFYRDSSITWQTIFNQGESVYGRCHGIAGVGRWTNQNKCRTKKYSHFDLFSCRRHRKKSILPPSTISKVSFSSLYSKTFHGWFSFLLLYVYFNLIFKKLWLIIEKS